MIVGYGRKVDFFPVGHCCVSPDSCRHDASCRLDSEGQRDYHEEATKIEGLKSSIVGKNGSLYGGTMGYDLLGGNGLEESSVVKELGDHLSDLWDVSGASRQDNLFHEVLSELSGHENAVEMSKD